MKALALLFTSLIAITAQAATPPLAMNFAEKASHKLVTLAGRNAIDQSFLTDVTRATIAADANGAVIELMSPAVNPNEFNKVTLNFDATGNFLNFTTDFKGVNAASPIFKQANAATLIDLGAEAVVDHLADSADLPVVNENARTLALDTEGTGVHLRIGLNDGRTYSIMMDMTGVVISQGF